MIKAKKGLIITLFAAMMVFAFGATSAFASTDNVKAEWINGYTQVVISGCTDADANYNGTYDTERTFNASGPKTGQIDVSIDESKVQGLPTAVLNAAKTVYVDLNGAVLGHKVSGTANPIVPTYANFAAWNSNRPDCLILTAPEGTYTGTTAPTGYKSFNSSNQVIYGSWTGTYSTDPATVAESKEDQTVTLKFTQSWATSGTDFHVTGAVADKIVTIKGTPRTPSEALFFLDKIPTPVGSADVLSTAYDGAEHTVVVTEVPGYTVSWTVFDSTSGKWNPVDSVKVKNVDEDVTFKATFTNAAGSKIETVAKTASISTVGNADLKYGFVVNTNSGAIYKVEGAEYNVYDYVEAYSAGASDAAITKAVAADNQTLLAALKEVTKEKVKVDKDNPNKLTVSLAPKTISGTDKEAVEKTYKTLMDNFNITNINDLSGKIAKDADGDYAVNATVYINYVDPNYDYEVEFTNTPTAVTYKAKALKKKAKSFTVHAAANNGAPIKYKLINAPAKIVIDKTTGKVTLKKGLKKGTYKIKVKAYVPGVEDLWGLASETQSIKIKVKK